MQARLATYGNGIELVDRTSGGGVLTVERTVASHVAIQISTEDHIAIAIAIAIATEQSCKLHGKSICDGTKNVCKCGQCQANGNAETAVKSTVKS